MILKGALTTLLLLTFGTMLFSQNFSVNDTTELDSVLQPVIEFDTLSFELGDITEGTLVTKVFTFTNKGSETLTVIGVSSDCSCTVPEFTKGEFEIGDQGHIKVTYDSHGNAGRFIQNITVLHDAGEGYTFLTLKGFVVKQL